MNILRKNLVGYEVYQYKISLLAAGCLYCYREKGGIEPIWPECLSGITGYSEGEVKMIREIITKYDLICEIHENCRHSNTFVKTMSEKKPILEPNTGINNGANAPQKRFETAPDKENSKLAEKRKLNVYELYMNC